MEAGKMATHFLIAMLSFSSLMVLFGSSDASSVPAVYIFGDSTADVGNNNFLQTKAKANFPPNGVDFPYQRATGRFSNGFNSADFLARQLGFRRSPPAFYSLTEHTLPKHAARGINFASAGSGILETTGKINGECLSMSKQIQLFQVVRDLLIARMGAVATDELFSKSIFLVSTGSNDFFEYYAAVVSGRPANDTRDNKFTASIAYAYGSQLRSLYNLGARKMGIIGVAPIGCCPSRASANPSGECVGDLNKLARMFYMATKSTLQTLSTELKELKYSLGNSYEMVMNFFTNPGQFGFTEVKSACCGGGKLNGETPCVPNSTFCSNRGKYLFWDPFHPTHAACKLAAQTLFTGDEEFVTPINFGELAN